MCRSLIKANVQCSFLRTVWKDTCIYKKYNTVNSRYKAPLGRANDRYRARFLVVKSD